MSRKKFFTVLAYIGFWMNVFACVLFCAILLFGKRNGVIPIIFVVPVLCVVGGIFQFPLNSIEKRLNRPNVVSIFNVPPKMSLAGLIIVFGSLLMAILLVKIGIF